MKSTSKTPKLYTCWVCGGKTNSPVHHLKVHHLSELEDFCHSYMEDEDAEDPAS